MYASPFYIFGIQKFYKFVYIGISITNDNIPVGKVDNADVVVAVVDVTILVDLPRVVDKTRVRRSSPVGIEVDIAADEVARRNDITRTVVVDVVRVRRS